MIVEPPGLEADRVGAAVRAAWGVEVDTTEHLPVGAGAWHWRVGADLSPHWFATVHRVRTAEERQSLLGAFEAACDLAGALPFVVAPVRTRDARVAVDLAPGLLLSVTPFLEGTPGDGPPEDDAARAAAATLLGDLHAGPRPRHLPVWRPTIGWHPHAGRAELEAALDSPSWSGGPWSGPAGRLLADAAPVVRGAVRRFRLLGAAVSGSAERWVVTHGRPHGGSLLGTADGLRLVDWGSARLAPRERDLRDVLGGTDGDEPWFAYVEAGGSPDALAPDSVELFALEWHLSEVADAAVRFSGPHEDTADARRSFGDLEAELAALVEGWG